MESEKSFLRQIKLNKEFARKLRLPSLVLLLVICICCMPASAAESARLEQKPKYWYIPAFGSLLIPHELQIAEIADVVEFSKQFNLALPQAKEQLLPAGAAYEDLPFTMGLYQLTHFDGKDYRQAYAFSLALRESDTQLIPYFMGPPDSQKSKLAHSLQAEVKGAAEGFSYLDPQTRLGGKVLEITDLKTFAVGSDRTGYSGGGRYLINMQDFQFPFHVHGYATADHTGAPVIIAMIVVDSERKFWIKMMDSIFMKRFVQD